MKKKTQIRKPLGKTGKISAVLLVILLTMALSAIQAFAAEKVIVKNAAGTQDVFKVDDDGTMYVSDGGPTPGFSSSNTRAIISNTSNSSDRTYLSLIAGETTGISRINFGDPDSENVGFFSYSHSNNSMQVRAGGIEVMRFVNNKMSIGGEVSPDSTLSVKGSAAIGAGYSGSAAGPTDGLIVQGNVGIGTSSPSQKLYVVGNIYATGAITPGSSRELKDNIYELTSEEAVDALTELNPTKFTYKADPAEEHIGFIAEEVPELLATKDRKGVNTMDVVALLTKVVKEQQRTISELSEQNRAINEKVAELEKKLILKDNMAMVEAD